SLATGGALSTLSENVRLAARLKRAPRDGIVVIDELCHPRAALSALLHRLGPCARLVVLVHHLAASEREGIRGEARPALEPVLPRAPPAGGGAGAGAAGGPPASPSSASCSPRPSASSSPASRRAPSSLEPASMRRGSL